MDVRGLAPADETRAFDGVPVREADELGGPLSCFVGDFAGDLVTSQRLDTARSAGAAIDPLPSQRSTAGAP